MKVKEFEIIDNFNFNRLKIEIDYEKGGANFFSGVNVSRGYYLSISPYFKEVYGWTTHRAFTGTKILIEAVGRQNKKKLEKLVANFNLEDFQEVFDKVLLKNGIKKENLKEIKWKIF